MCLATDHVRASSSITSSSTPTVRRAGRDAEHRPIAGEGVRYTQWHTTALCSLTRSCLLTGRNHTRNSMACITEAASGFPNASG
jgi:arylsulfatase A-like enzyme